jgi:RNA polymerase sigma-70 factor, ECF subfamily
MATADNEGTFCADEDLLPRIAAGDRHAVAGCIRRYGPLVWTMARRFSVTVSDAEDAVQEIFTDLWTHAGRYDARRGKERVYVTILARRRLIDRRRSSRRRYEEEVPLDEVPESAAPAGSHAERDADIELARHVLAQLPTVQQRAIMLSLAHGYSHAEVARHTGLPLGTVKTQVRRGILRVRALLLGRMEAPVAAGDGR